MIHHSEHSAVLQQMAKGHGANGHEQHLDMEDVEDRNLLLTLLLHASDVSNPVRVLNCCSCG